MCIYYCRCVPIIAGVYLLLQVCTYYCRCVPIIAGVYLLLQVCTYYCRCVPIIAGVYLLLQVCTYYCRCVPIIAGVYLLLQVCTYYCRCVPIIAGVYLICVLGTSMLTLVFTVIVLRLHHGNPIERVPPWIHSLVVCMATVTWQRTNLRLFKTTTASQTNYDVTENKGVSNGSVNPVKPDELEKEKNDLDLGTESSAMLSAMLDEMRRYRTETGTVLRSMLQEMRRGRNETAGVAWTTAAVIVDRFCAVIFLFVIIIINVIMLVIMPTI